MASSTDEFRRLMNERGRIKASLTRFKAYYEANRDLDSASALQQRLDRSMEPVQDRIETLVWNTTDKEAHLQIHEDFETTFDEVTAEVKDHLCHIQALSLSVGASTPATFDFFTYLQRRVG